MTKEQREFLRKCGLFEAGLNGQEMTTKIGALIVISERDATLQKDLEQLKQLVIQRYENAKITLINALEETIKQIKCGEKVE